MVYAKRPFAGPQQVLDYVGRYTHRVAISNNRLLSIDDGKVRFRWKDYRRRQSPEDDDLDGDEFIRRFLIHVLPDGFHRIRYYGFLGNCSEARHCRQDKRRPGSGHAGRHRKSTARGERREIPDRQFCDGGGVGAGVAWRY